MLMLNWATKGILTGIQITIETEQLPSQALLKTKA